ncbi:MAG: hypothetical protein JOY62_05125 [Acidobacteriaceae bacterium]|nr:hypothetical protein [Acidobacteriaceae bacterium]MBV9779337.1 hypothetical protein [Acidobacteriaceae bacterium]
MAFCPNCGAQVTGSFCPNCGTAVAGTTGTTGSSYSTPPPVTSAPGLTENVAGALCYLFGLVTGIIFLVIAPYNQNKTVRFHAFQSIFANLAVIAFYIVWGMVSFLTHGFAFLLYPLFGLLFFLLWLYMMYAAYTNKKVKLPVIGDLAEKQA